jgi:hypothetical protein
MAGADLKVFLGFEAIVEVEYIHYSMEQRSLNPFN